MKLGAMDTIYQVVVFPSFVFSFLICDMELLIFVILIVIFCAELMLIFNSLLAGTNFTKSIHSK